MSKKMNESQEQPNSANSNHIHVNYYIYALVPYPLVQPTQEPLALNCQVLLSLFRTKYFGV